MAAAYEMDNKGRHLRCAAHAEAGNGAKVAVVPDVERVVEDVGAPQPLQRGRTTVYLHASDMQGTYQKDARNQMLHAHSILCCRVKTRLLLQTLNQNPTCLQS